MKRVFSVILMVCIFFSCETPLIEKIEGKFPNQQPKLISYYQKEGDKEVKIEEKHFYDNGQLKMVGKFRDGEREGEWKAYFNNGQIQSEGVFESGLRVGVAKVYYPNGKLRYEGQYENNEEVGRWKFYNKEGKLVQEKDF